MSHLSRDERLLALDGALEATRAGAPGELPGRAAPTSRRSAACWRASGRSTCRSRRRCSGIIWRRASATRSRGSRRRCPDRGWWSPRLAWAAAAVVIVAAGAGYLTRSQPQPARPSSRTARRPSRDPVDAAPLAERRRCVRLRRRRLGAHRGGGRPGPSADEALRAAGRAGRAVDLGAVRRRAPGAGGRAGRRTGAGPEPGRMTAIMCGRTFRRAAALGGRGARRRARRRPTWPARSRGAFGPRPPCRPRDRRRGPGRRTRTSIRPSSGGCSMPTR